ncbi:MAG: hypothetical protein ABI577_14330 [bacterium]
MSKGSGSAARWGRAPSGEEQNDPEGETHKNGKPSAKHPAAFEAP